MDKPKKEKYAKPTSVAFKVHTSQRQRKKRKKSQEVQP